MSLTSFAVYISSIFCAKILSLYVSKEMNEHPKDVAPPGRPVKPKKKYSSRLPRRYGSREEVWIGEALMTRGLLKKADLLEKNGKIISKKISEASSKKTKLSTVFTNNAGERSRQIF